MMLKANKNLQKRFKEENVMIGLLNKRNSKTCNRKNVSRNSKG